MIENKRKMLLRALSFLALTAALGGCTARHQPPPDTLVVALGAMPATLDPRFATDADGTRISALIFESLVHAGDDYQPQPEAAVRWSKSGLRYTFHLRPDLQFHNGRKVTVEDIEYSFATYRGPKSAFASTLSAITSVVARGEGDHLVVDVLLKAPSEKFLIADLPSVRILPKREIESMGRDFTRALIGTGPFRYGKTDLNEIRLESARAQMAHLTFKIVRDDYTRYLKLLKGEVDIAQVEIAPERVREFEQRPQEFNVYRYHGRNMSYLLLNLRDPVLRRLEARQALARTLRRDEVIRYKLAGFGREATSILTPENPYFADLQNLKTDVPAARAQITRLGLADQRLVLKTSNNVQAIENGRVLANQLSESGLNVELESYEWGTYYADIKKGAFQIALMRWVNTVDPDIYRIAFHSKELPPGRNRGAYINRELDQLLDQSSVTDDRARRQSLFKRIQRHVHTDLAILPLWYDEQVAIARKNVLNFKPSMSSDFLPLARVTKAATHDDQRD